MSNCIPPARVYPELNLPKWEPYDIKHNRDFSPEVAAIAARYEAAPWWRVPKDIRASVITRTLELFAAIPVPVLAIPGCEPFANVPAMQEYIKANGFFPVRLRGKHPVFGTHLTEFRAVHDWYGHILTNHPFTIAGEMAAYETHTSQFPKCTLPVIWENVVLENAFFVSRGHWLHYPANCGWCHGKIAFDHVKFGEVPQC